MNVDMGMRLEEMGNKDLVNCEARVKKECEQCSRCLDLEDDITEANKKCKLLELEIEKKRNVMQWLEGKLGFAELIKLKLEDEVRALKQRNEDLERSIRNGERVFEKGEKGMTAVIDLTELSDEEDKVAQLMIENKVLECEKNKAESEVEVWKVKCRELEKQVVELQNKTLRDMTIEGLDLPKMDSEKLSEEGRPVHVRASVVQTDSENKASEDKDGTDTAFAFINTPTKPYASAEGVKGSHQCDFKFMPSSHVRKRLGFAEEGSPCMNFSPSTPCGRPPFGPIDDSDNGNNVNTPQLHLSDPDIKGGKKICSSMDIGSGNTSYKNELTSKDRCTRDLEHQSEDDEDITCYNWSTPHLSTPKRRKVLKIVTSDGESDNDDVSHNTDSNPNSNSVCDTDSRDKLKKPIPRRRLRRLGSCEERWVPGKSTHESTESKNTFGIPKYETVDGDETEEDYSSSEGESLGGFIVSSSDMSDIGISSNCIDTSNDDGPFSSDDTSGESKKSSDSSMDHNEIISGLCRDRRTHKMKWNFEAEMLADFGKLPEVCMMAVCALYRQQTSEEKSYKATIVNNGRGFSQPHAHSGSALAEFLTDGDAQGDVKKSVTQLLKFNPKGVQLCENFARHYSKQLFAIYQNKEDPFFRPP